MPAINRANNFQNNTQNFDTLGINDADSRISGRPFFAYQKMSSISSQSNICNDLPQSNVSGDGLHLKPIEHILKPEYEALKGRFKLLQQWKGIVIGIKNSTLEVELQDTTNKKNPKEYADIEIEEIPSDDYSLIEKGAVFYWSIGYFDGPGRPRTRESRIRFRRLPNFTEHEVNLAAESAKYMENFFSGHRL